MKKGLLFGIFIIMSVALFAQERTSASNAGFTAQHETHVTPTQALNVGYTFMSAGAGTGLRGGGTRGSDVRKQAMQLVYTGQAYDSLTSTITDCYYVFALQPKGFVIVAADDRVEPILGYSYDNEFMVANMPAHVRGWLGNYEKQIEAVAKSDLQPTPETQTKWARLKSGQSMSTRSGGNSVGPLLTTMWDQYWPWNDKCPVDTNGDRCLAGCVAVALGQIMKYHSYPQKGYGYVHYTLDNIPDTISANFDTTYYDWQSMPDGFAISGYESMAQLLADIGKSLFMQYSVSSSGSFEDAQTLADVFNYDYFSMQKIQREHMDDSTWTALIKNELDNNRPVYYSGYSDEDPTIASGHGFVCDGYDASNMFHFNFGWGGNCNGFFHLSHINSLIFGNYNYYQSALIGIQPSTGTTLSGYDTLSGSLSFDESLYCGAFSHITILPGTELKFAPGKSMAVSGSILSNGTESEPILITASDTNSGWGGMQIHPAMICYKMAQEPDTLSLNHTTISYSSENGLDISWPDYFIYPAIPDNVIKKGITLRFTTIHHNNGMGLCGETARLVLDSSEVSFNGNWGIHFDICGLDILNSTIHNNHGAIYQRNQSEFFDISSHIVNNDIFSNYYQYYGSTYYGSETEIIAVDCELRGNRIFDNNQCEDDLSAKNVIRGGRIEGNSIHDNNCESAIVLAGPIVGNKLYNNTGKAIFLFVNGTDIYNNLIFNNGEGIYCSYENSPSHVFNNTIVNNTIGIDYGHWGNGTIYLSNNIIWNNENEVDVHDCLLSANNNIIRGGCSNLIGNGPNNHIINTCDKNPIFINPTVFIGPGNIPEDVNFAPALSSPAIDFGFYDTTLTLPAIDLGGNPRVNRILDIGAYENQSDTVHPCFFTESNTVKSCVGLSVDMSMPYRGEQCSFAWYHNDNLIPNSDSDTLHIETVASNDEGDYFCVISNVLGTDTSSIIHLVLSPQLPGCIEAINGPDTLYHFQQNIPFSINNVLDADNIEWTVSEGLSIVKTSDTSILVSVNQAVESAFLYVVASNGCGACADTAMIHFTVLPLPGQLRLHGDEWLITNCDFSWPNPTIKADNSFYYDDIEWQVPSWLNTQSWETGVLHITSSSIYDEDIDTLYARWVINGYGTGDWTAYPMRVFHSENYGNIVYVTVDGGGREDGSSWFNATPNLTDGILIASYLGKKLWVAGGTYYGDNESEFAFTLTRHIEMYGGFAGNEGDSFDITLRNLSHNISVLDGQNRQGVIRGYGDTYWYATSIIDGFVFQNGKGGCADIQNDTIRNCIFRYNSDGVMASAVYGGVIINCAFYGNTYRPILGSLVYNTTIVNNSGDVDVIALTNSIVRDSYVWGDVNYSAVEAWEGGGDGNLLLARNNDGTSPDSNYVRFVDPENGDFRLAYGSACINAGTPDISELGLPSVDLQGLPRVLDGRIDMGAYEYYPVPVVETYDTLCEGNSVTFYGTEYSIEGTYTAHANPDPMLDTMYILHLTVNPADSTDFTETVCGSYAWNGETFTTSGDHTRTLTAANGCDSVVTLHLTILPALTVAISGNQHVCESEPVALTANVETGGIAPENLHYTWFKDGQVLDNMAFGLGNSNEFVDYMFSRTEPYHFTVEVTYGTDASCVFQSEEYLVYVHPQPSLFIDASEITICEGSTATLTAFVDGSVNLDCAYQWFRSTPGSNTEPVSGGTTYATMGNEPADTYTYWVQATSEYGCISQSNQITLTINPNPSVTISGNTEICPGGSTVLSANITPGQDASYVWYKDGAEMALHTPSFTVTDGGSYMVEATVNGCSAFSGPVFVTSEQSMGLQLMASNLSICIGDYTAIMADAMDLHDGNILYSWSEDFAIGSFYTFFPDHVGSHTITVTATNDLTGCMSVDSITINVYDTPATPVVTVDQASIFDGDQVLLSITNPDFDPTASYTWYRNGAVIPGATQPTIVDNPSTVGGETTDYVYTVVVMHLFTGCTSEPSEPTVVTVNATLTATVIAEGNTVLCEGGSTTLHVNVTPTNNSYSYQWYVNGSLIPGATSAEYVVSEPASSTAYNFAVAVFASGGLDFLVYAPAITVMPAPTVIAFSSETNICEGGTTTMSATAYGPLDSGNGYNFQWFRSIPNPDGTFSTNLVGTDASYTTSSNVPVNSYTYWVQATSEYGCSSQSGPIMITVNPNPSVTISGNTAFCEGGSTTLSAFVSSGQSADYVWYKNGSTIAFNTSSITVTEGGSYAVEATVNGCSASSEPFLVTVEEAPILYLTATETNICVDGHTTILAEVVNMSDENILYSWSEDYAFGSAYTFSSEQAGVHTITVTATDITTYCQGTNSIAINVNNLPETPVVTVDNTLVFDGGQVTLTVANPVGYATYIWYRNGELIPGATQASLVQYLTAVGGETTTYSYVVMASLVNSGCVSDISAPTVVTVGAMPVVTVAAQGNTMFCEGGSVTLHADVTPYNDPTYSYQWYEDGMLIPGATTPDYVVYEAARTNPYNFMVMVSAMGSGFITTAYAPPITIVANPVVTATISEDIICAGGTATLTATVEGGIMSFNGYNYQWFGIVGAYMTMPDLIGTEISYTTTGEEPAGNYPFWVSVSNEYGCNSQSEVVVLSVVSKPAATITRAAGYDGTVCEGGSTALVANVNGGYGSTNYQWLKNGFILPNETDTVLTINDLTSSTNDVYAVSIAQEGVGCFGFASTAIHSLVTVVPHYTVDVIGPDNVCEGDFLTLFAAVDNTIPGDMPSYQWHEIVNGQDMLVEGANSVTYTVAGLQSGNAYDYYVVVNSSISGCSAISASQAVNVNVPSNNALYENACNSYTWNGTTYTETGEYTQTFTGVNGCDSVVTLHLTVNQPNFGDTTAIAQDIFDWYEHTYLTMSGDYTHIFTNQSGCDSVVTLHLTITNPTISVQDTVMTAGYFIWHGMVFTSDTVLTETIPVLGGYDSVVFYHVFVTPTPLSVLTVDTCVSYTLNGQTYAETGDYVQNFPTPSGIDSVVVLYLTIFSADSVEFTETACGSYPWNGETFISSGDYTRTFTNANGCDSVVTLHLTISPADSADFAETACGSYPWNGETFTTSGDYTRTFTNANGCDSVVTLHLTIYPADTADFAETACESFTWNGTTYTTSGDYTQIFTNASGCDSVVTLHLTIYPAPVVTVTADNYYVCESGEVAFTADVAPAGLYNYAWTINDAPQAVNTATVTTIANGFGPISASVIVSFANAGAPCTASDTIDTPVTVVEQPSWTNVSFSDNNLCLGETILLEATIQGGVNNGGDTNGYIQWVVTDMNGLTLNVTSGSGGSAYDIPFEAGIYNYTPTFVGNLGNGCQLTNTNAVQGMVTVHEPPAAQFISGHGTAICDNDPNASAELVIAFMGVAPFTYQVVDDHDNILAHATTLANTASLYVAPSTQTTYTITMIQDSYCENTDLTSNASATVYVNAPVYTDLYEAACEHYTLNYATYDESGDYTQVFPAANGCDSIITLHLTVNFPVTNVVEVTTSDSCYTWNSETYCASGQYTQTLQTIDGCDSTVYLFLTITVGIDDHSDFDFNLYPNPTNGMVNVQCTMNNVQAGTMEYHVFDAYGKLVDVVETRCTTSLQTAQIDLSGYAAGVYFVKALAEGNVVAVRKVVKR